MEGLGLPDDWLVWPASLMAGMACQSHPQTGWLVLPVPSPDDWQDRSLWLDRDFITQGPDLY